MRRFVWVALAAGAACSEVSNVEPGPTDVFYRPTGIGVHAGKLVVASSNADLRYDSSTGGSVTSVDPAVIRPDPDFAAFAGGLDIESFAGQMAIADPAICPGIGDALALVPVRGANLLYRVRIGPGGGLACDGCGLSVVGTSFADAYSVGVACRLADPPSGSPGMARAYVGYLRTLGGQAWITEVDLASGTVRGSNSYGLGQMRSFAYDAARNRLYAAQAPQGIRWIDLAGDCQLAIAETDPGGCHGGATALPAGLQAFAIALSRPGAPAPARRLYVLARVFDSQAAAAAGVRAGDVDGVLLVTELVDDVFGQTQLRFLKAVPVGYGPVALALLPGRTGRRDVVAALASDDAVLVLFDDDTDDRVVISRDPATGHPWLGGQPFGLAVDSVTAGTVAHVYVGSFPESFVTQIDVPLADINLTSVPPGGAFRRIRGGTL
ncbi:MAG TPA: hypothetical protein VIW03_04240 [Anaeromyxobacter sp.]